MRCGNIFFCALILSLTACSDDEPEVDSAIQLVATHEVPVDFYSADEIGDKFADATVVSVGAPPPAPPLVTPVSYNPPPTYQAIRIADQAELDAFNAYWFSSSTSPITIADTPCIAVALENPQAGYSSTFDAVVRDDPPRLKFTTWRDTRAFGAALLTFKLHFISVQTPVVSN